jgi:hypothetical protein
LSRSQFAKLLLCFQVMRSSFSQFTGG